ncbi:hybrid sensor histidine kinase/response regulator [Massilia sp. DD77]|uniref:hybrid sensor histidine kinase/response regulator n=1 Tax=Massilia sp. DD77 TaxID=3109349 RepID=UPI002FFEBABF
MSDPAAFHQRLLAIFADEAQEHLRRIEASLAALERREAPARRAALEEMLKTLHTLKGAARAVDLDHLERLCHALESLCTALAASAAAPGTEELDRLHRALALARELAAAGGGRARNQAEILCRELDQAAQGLHAAPSEDMEAAPPPQAAPPVPMAEPSGDPEPARGEELVMVRVRAAQIDAIRTETEALLASELALLHQAGELRRLARELGAGASHAAVQLRCERLAQDLAASCTGLAITRKRLMGAVLETALEPFGSALGELPSLVRKLARSRGREAAFDSAGADIQVDRRVLAVLREVLIHLVTNAVDHGIEAPAQRRAAGKPDAGHLRVVASQPDARHVLVRVEDDGAGMDAEAVARAAARAGVAADLEGLDEAGRLALALRAGVSTRAELSEVSGRGLGLAVVADKVAQLGGTVRIESRPGAGCAFELLLPVSLASLRALVVEVAGRRFAVPLGALDTVRAVPAGSVRTVEGRETVALDGRVLPLVRLASLCGAPQPETALATGVALLAGARYGRFALLVDAIVSEQDVLPRGLGPLLQRVRCFSGATQLGDGSLVPVLALDDLGALAQGAPGPAPPAGPDAAPGTGQDGGKRVLVAEDSVTSRLLLKHILEGAGYRVDAAADGMEALSRLRQGRYDAVVSDVEMPHLDGIGLTAGIRQDPRTADLPVILVTSLQTPAERERGLHAGADAYLTKGSFDQDQLLALLGRMT